MKQSAHVQTVGVVACCALKLPNRALAQDIYISPLFQLSRAYVERSCERWIILSTQHGVLLPYHMIKPYDLTLRGMTPAQRQDWAEKCRADLQRLFPGASYIVLAGHLYRAALAGLPCEVPMEGLGIGQQLAWLQRALKEAA